MTVAPSSIRDEPVPYLISRPSKGSVPVVFSSPHSGRFYPPDFVAETRLPADQLRSSEDAFVDELFACVPDYGAALIAAQYARAYCDPNREPYELDPVMFSGPLPPAANIRSPRVAAGLGTIPKTVGGGAEIYKGRLPVTEIERRLSRSYRPYHEALKGLIEDVRATFGWCLLIDCHSMPPVASWRGDGGADIVLGDCHGGSCSGVLTQVVEEAFRDHGYSVDRNMPYAGGYTTRYWGHPKTGSHALQIEISRALYMDPSGLGKGAGFPRIQSDIEAVVSTVLSFVLKGYPI